MSCVTPGNFLSVTPTRIKKNASDLLDHTNTLHHGFTWIFGYDAMVGITRSKLFVGHVLFNQNRNPRFIARALRRSSCSAAGSCCSGG